jgi:glycosyltransferase involved in cell wall biosynthesis
VKARRRVHLLTGEYPPGAGGVGDYAAQVAEGLAAAGREVHVWCPGSGRTGGAVTIHPLPDWFGRGSRRVLARAFAREPGRVLLQYAPNACGARGANVAFCRWLARQAATVDIRVMFHEPYFYFSWHPTRNALALVQRAMAAYLLRAARVAYVSTETWARYLRPYAPAGSSFVPLPIPATVAVDAEPAAVSAWRQRLAPEAPLVAHFGSYGDHVSRELASVLPALLTAHPSACVVCAGRGSEAFAARFRDTGRVMAAYGLDGASVAAVLRAADVAVQPYPDGVTTRRTTVMACLANGVPTVTTSGALTEPVWQASGGVVLAPAGRAARIAEATAALLRDPGARIALGARARCLYEREFSLERTIAALASDAEPSWVTP